MLGSMSYVVQRPIVLVALFIATAVAQQQPPDADLHSVPPDLITPSVEQGSPAPGKRVKQAAPGYESTGVYHALYLPTDWKRGKRYPVIVEYAGNGPYRNKYGDYSSGMIEGSNLGYGISGGKGFIWISMPYVNSSEKRNQLAWWGDVKATVEYCQRTVRRICEEYGGDPSAVIIAGFSRGAIACNYIGLHDDKIADTWLAFIAYSHYDGVRTWDYPGSDRPSALERLKRLAGRAVFACHEESIEATRAYVESTGLQGSFSFAKIPFQNHNDAWTLRNIAERRQLRDWVKHVLKVKPGTHSIRGRVADLSGKPISGALVESGATHWTTTDDGGVYVLSGLIDSHRTISASKSGFSSESQTVVVSGMDVRNINFSLSGASRITVDRVH